MKRIVSILMTVAMIASVAVVNVSAAGQIYMQDNFETLDYDKWLVDVSNFFIEDGWLVGDNSAVVHQTMFGVEPEDDSGRVNMTWNECYVSVDIRLSDYSDDLDDYSTGLWWKDYQLAPGEEWYEGFEYTKGAIYSLSLHTETNRVALWGDYQELETVENTDSDEEVEVEEKPLMEVVLPEDTFAVNFINPTIVNLGMEITSTGISAFLDGVHLFTWNSPTLLGQNQASPILLVNEGLIVGFDNFIVTSLDWNGVPEKTSTLVGGNYFDDPEVVAVRDAIDVLGHITTADQEADVAAVRDAYNDLSYNQKICVTNYDVLEAAEVIIEDMKAANEVVDAIQDIAGVTEADIVADPLKASSIEAASDAYATLTEAQQSFVHNVDVLVKAELELEKYYAPDPGDYNGDNTVNVLDAILLVKEFVGDGVAAAEGTDLDYNTDGEVNILDAVAIVNEIVG